MKIEYTEGRLFLEDKEWILDAEPQVLTLFERLFTSSTLANYDSDSIRFGHRPRKIQDILSVRKDLAWFINRFKLEISEKDLRELQQGSIRYDKVLEAERQAFTDYKPIDLDFALPLRDYQEQAVSLILHRGRLLVADQIGLGKTAIGIAVGVKHAPALCVVPSHLVTQWGHEILKFLPKARVHTIRTGKNYRLPMADFYIVSYNLVHKWVEKLGKIKLKSIVLDEVHSLRRGDTTEKYKAVAILADMCNYKIGLSATPIMNYGVELYNVFKIIDPDMLGEYASFSREWCHWGKISNPELLGNFLRKNMMMIRRTRKEVAKSMEPINKIVYNVDADLEALQQMEQDAKILAMKVITGDFHESGEAAREFDYKLRMATGIAKAKSVAEMVKMVVESGEKVVLFGWHREVYRLWMNELYQYRPVMFTGSETPKEKDASLKEFVEGNSQVFIMSLRSGAGINGLQFASSYCIFGELDWSPGVIDQCIGRLWRDGQKDQVTAMFITIEDGADPIMQKVIGKKAIEALEIMDPEAEVLAKTGDGEKILGMAKDWLKAHGENVDAIIEKRDSERKGELFIDPPKPGESAFDVYNILQKYVVNFVQEDEMQSQIERIFRKHNIVYEREFIISDNSRVDFKVGDVLVECKAKGFNKRALLSQIRRYKREYHNTSAIVIVTPDHIKSFKLQDVNVYSVNMAPKGVLIGGLS